MARRCRTGSPATPIPRPGPRHPNRPRPPATGIDYLRLVADTHHAQVADDERIGFHALYSTAPGQIPGQTSIDDLDLDDVTDDPDTDAPEQTRPAQGAGR